MHVHMYVRINIHACAHAGKCVTQGDVAAPMPRLGLRKTSCMNAALQHVGSMLMSRG